MARRPQLRRRQSPRVTGDATGRPQQESAATIPCVYSGGDALGSDGERRILAGEDEARTNLSRPLPRASDVCSTHWGHPCRRAWRDARVPAGNWGPSRQLRSRSLAEPAPSCVALRASLHGRSCSTTTFDDDDNGVRQPKVGVGSPARMSVTIISDPCQTRCRVSRLRFP